MKLKQKRINFSKNIFLLIENSPTIEISIQPKSSDSDVTLDSCGETSKSSSSTSIDVATKPQDVQLEELTIRTTGKVFHETFITEIKPICTTNPSSLSYKKPFYAKKNNDCDTIGTGSMVTTTGNNNNAKKLAKPLKHTNNKSVLQPAATGAPQCIEYTCRQRTTPSKVIGQYRFPKRRNTIVPTATPPQPSAFINNLNFSSDISTGRTTDSNMFLYIDLHGHASKKGIFMYGNHLQDIAEAVECMLLPRLMSMNCHHFHFDACVFSERNMYHK